MIQWTPLATEKIKIEETKIEASDPITALLEAHASIQREHKVQRDGYKLLRFWQVNYSDYDFPEVNPLITDEIIGRLPAASRKRYLPPPPKEEKKTNDKAA